jgi:putative endonuclease
MAHWVYILYSKKNRRFYIGETSDLQRRLDQHNRGNVPSTASFTPWRIAFFIEKSSRTEALVLEKKLKNLHSPKRIIAFIKKYGKWEFDEDL